jgi:hypothetical protein
MRILSIANFVMGLFFAYAAAMQLNDPDSLLWIVIYSTASLLSFSKAIGFVKRISLIYKLFTALCIVFLIGRLLSGMVDMEPQTEIGRENLGLLIVVFWMLVSSLDIALESPILALGILGLTIAVLSSVYVIPKMFLTTANTEGHCQGIGFAAPKVEL